MRHQTYGYLPSRKASPPIGWYQIILLGDRGTCVLTTCRGLHSTAGRPGFEPATCWWQVQHSNHVVTKPHNSLWHDLNDTHLSCYNIVSKHGNSCCIADKVGNRLHDIPWVLPPCKSCHETKLCAHQCKTNPWQLPCPFLSFLLQLFSDLYRTYVTVLTIS